MPWRPDPPELSAACDMLRQIYWREYGRGWREATQRVKEVLEREAEAVRDSEPSPST